MKKRVLAAAIAAMCFVGTAPVSVVPIAGVAENVQEQTVLTENNDAITTTIAVTETKPVTTITMPVVDSSIMTSDYTMTVTVIEINGSSLLVKNIESSRDVLTLPANKLDNSIKPVVGMKLEVTYNGGILETYPGQFGNIQKVVEVKDDTVKEDPTLLKGTKDMTLNDVMRLAELGDDLDWADFDNYNGKIMPVNAWVNGWHFDLGNDFSLEVLGNPPDKPEIVRLYHYDFDNGIDIRTNDVKEYIASTATPVNSTDLQGTKNMTINDVIELAKKGDELNWSDFDEYVGKDGWHGVGMYTHTCSFELGDGYVLYVGGNQPTQPETILLYRNDPKSGIDIRTDDVKEYIASKAIDSDETDFSGITAIVEPEKAKELFNKYFKENNVDAECIANETYPDYHSPLVVEYVLETGTINGKQIVEFAEKNNIERTLFRVVPIINGERVYKVNAIVNVTITEPEEALRIFNKYFKDNNIDAECVKNETYPDYHSPLVVEYVLETGTINGKQIVEFAEKNNIERTLFRVVPIINGERVYKVNADINLSGDTNCDGSVDMADAVLIMQALANPNKYGIDGTADHHLTEQGMLNGDMDGDGLTVGDAQAIQRKLLGLDKEDVQKIESYLTANAGFLYESGSYTIFFIGNGKYFCRRGSSSIDKVDNGTYTISRDTVVLTGQFGTNRFRYEDNTLIYIEEGSDGFNDVKPKNGEKFYAVLESSNNTDTQYKLSDIVTIKTNYNPAMSDWSGIGILLEFDSPEYDISLEAADGQFVDWDIKKGSGPIKNAGKTYEIGKSGYVFWNPDDMSYTDGFETEITVKGTNKSKQVELGKIYITNKNSPVYTASLEKPGSSENIDSSNNEVNSSADYPCAIKINGTVFWQTNEKFSEDFSNYTINKVTAYSENGTPQNDGESNFDRKCTTEYIILDEKTIVVKLQDGLVGYWIFRAK